jgi:fucose permease
MVTTLLGPIVPALVRRWALPDADVGALFSAQFLCSTAFSMASSSLVLRFDATRVLAAGFGLMAVGVGALGLAQWPVALAPVAFYGCGLGLVLPTTNFLVVAVDPNRASAAVSLVNMSWSIGAVTWPILVALLGRPADVVRPTVLLGALLAVLAVRLLTLAQPQTVVAPNPTLSNSADRPWPTPLVSGRTVALFAILMFLYAGTEAAIGGWMAEHVRRLDPSRAGWTLAPTLFYAALATGRLLGPAMLRIGSETTVMIAGLSLATCATLILIVSRSVPLAFTVAAAGGLGLAPVFPITLARMARIITPSRPRLVGPLFSVTGMGSASLPWAVGYCSTLSQSLRVGYVVPLVGCIAMAALATLKGLRDRV